MATATKSQGQKIKGQSRKSNLSAEETALLETTVAPVVAEEATAPVEAPSDVPDDRQDGEETAPEEDGGALLTPAEAQEKEEERMANTLAEADKLLKAIGAAALKAETSYSVSWLRVGLDCIDYARKRMSVGHGFAAVCDTIKAKIGTYASYALNVDQMMRASGVWDAYCVAKGITDDKGREKVARSITWGTWFNALSSLAQTGKDSDGMLVYGMLANAVDECAQLIADVAEKGFNREDSLAKCAEIRRTNAQREKAEQDRIAALKAKEEQEARDREAAAHKAKDDADRIEREKNEQRIRLEQEAKDAQEAAQAAQEEAEAADDDEAKDKAEEEAAHQQEAAEAKTRQAQEAAEEQEKARQKKEAADKLAREQRETLEKAKKDKEAAERAGKAADKEIVKADESIQKREARLTGNGSSAAKKTERKEDKGENLLTVAKSAAPADLASMMFAMLKANQMPFIVLKEFLEILNDAKEGGKLFAADKTAQNVITAALVAIEDSAKEGAAK